MSGADVDFLFSTKNEVFRAYAFYAALLALKMFVVTFTTAYYRFFKRVFANPEDATIKGAKVNYADPDVERVRRAHLNDLENIVPFWVVGLLYVGTNPCATVAINCFRIFAVSRIIHTFVYIYAVPQPSRALSFFAGVGTTIFMAVMIMINFC